MKKSLLITTLALAAAAAQAVTYYTPTNPPASLTLAWDASPDSGVTNYFVYYGPAPGQYTNKTAVGAVTNATLSGFAWGGRYYFAATASGVYGGMVLESDLSNEVSYQFPKPGAPGGLRTTNAIVRVAVESAPSPLGPWTPFATLAAVPSAPAFFRSVVSINPPEAAAAATRRAPLRAPKSNT